MTENKAIGRIRTQLLWDRLLAVVEEQAQTLVRTAFSTTVREAGDLSAGVFDTQGRMLAQAVTGTPGHVNAMAASVAFFLEKFPLEALQPGDVLVTNDPWHGTGHLNDFTVVTPVFLEQRAVALFASTSHIADVGGLGFGPDGRRLASTDGGGIVRVWAIDLDDLVRLAEARLTRGLTDAECSAYHFDECPSAP